MWLRLWRQETALSSRSPETSIVLVYGTGVCGADTEFRIARLIEDVERAGRHLVPRARHGGLCYVM